MMVPYLRINFYLTEIFNENMQLFHAAGLIDVLDRLSKTTIERPLDVDHDRQPISRFVVRVHRLFVCWWSRCFVLLCRNDFSFSETYSILSYKPYRHCKRFLLDFCQIGAGAQVSLDWVSYKKLVLCYFFTRSLLLVLRRIFSIR